MNPENSPKVIEIQNVSRQFGSKVALRNVSLDVPKGIVFGLVGENGAGKTTLIKHLLGLFRPKGGSVRVFGLDPVADPVGVLGHIGYLSEDRELPDWMRLGELMNYTRAFYPTWDDSYAEELRQTFGLDPHQRIKSLSRGQRAQAGLLIALAHRPQLLLLDEPSSGLDAVVRQDILGAIIRTVADEGRTVVFSSHLLDEVERVADHVAMIHQGSVLMCDDLDAIKAAHHRIALRFDTAHVDRPHFPGAISCKGEGRDWTVLCHDCVEEIKSAVASSGAEIVEQSTPSLEEIFVAHVKN